MKRGTSVLRICSVISLMAAMGTATAQQAYPARPVRLITPYEPGGSSSIVSRLVGHKLTELWGYPVIIDNRPGGNTVIGTQAGARATADGYTLTFANTTFVINHLLIPKLPYDALKDFTPLANLYNNETLLAVHASVPVSNLQEFVEYAKVRPGDLNNGASGIGGFSAMRSEMFRLLTRTNIKNIAYKGSGPVVTALLGGHVQLAMVPPITVASYINAGRLKGIAVTGTHRLSTLPQVPTFTEAGLPGYNVTSWNGLLVPSGTPRVVIDKVSNDVAKVLAAADLRERLASQGAEPAYAGPGQFAVIMRDDLARYARVIKEANIQMSD